MSEQVNHPSHYNQIKGIECIDVAEQLNFNLGNALKYIWRCEDKGNKIQDLKKAIWYIDREIKNETAKSKSLEPNQAAPEDSTSREVCEHFAPIYCNCDCVRCNS